MATLTVQETLVTGLEATYDAAANGGDEFVNNGDTYVHVKNAGGSDRTVTVASQVSPVPEGTQIDDKDVVVQAGEERFIGPFLQSAYNDSSGMVQLTYSSEADLTLAVIKGEFQ